MQLTKADIPKIDKLLIFIQSSKAEMDLKEAANVIEAWTWLSNIKKGLEEKSLVPSKKSGLKNKVKK